MPRSGPRTVRRYSSDRGSEYMGEPFCALVSLKAELIRGTSFAGEHRLSAAPRAYIRYYNTVRLHSSLAYTAPLAFERGTA